MCSDKLEEPSKSGEIEAVTKAKGFYEACMNTEAIEREGNVPLHKLMEDLGGLPVLGSESGGKWNQNAYSFEDLIVISFQVTDSVPILYVHLDDVYLVGQEKYRLNFDQPSLNLPRQLYLQGKEDPALMALKTYYLELFQAFGANESAAAKFAENTLDLEIDLANISSDNQYESSVIKIVPVSSLQEFGVTANFSQIVEGIYQSGGYSLNASDVVTIFSIGYFNNTVTVLNKHSNSVIANYIVTKVVMTQVNFLPRIYTDITERFLAASGQASNSASTRLEYCVNMLRDRMPDVITRIFAKEAFLEKDRRYKLLSD
ncbi:neprilysin-4-like [Ruditapes philippinarum]|uniref:neprilysin-4-like n=1 Tax=Ruditapes philippinarum TaxID=129788 RepID=UPI00295BD811|nr:neprilysin-4-like [Ruditapes philippinarum]